MAFGGAVAALGAGTVGAVQVVLDADASRLNAGLTAAQKKTAASTVAMEKRAANMKAAWAAAAVVAGAALIKFGVSSVQAFKESEAANVRLQNTLKNNPMLADVSRKAFEEQAAALQDLTGVQDEAVITAQALLGQFELTGKQVQELVPLVVDFAEKQNVDMVAAAKAVGKATAGSAGILSRYGIKVDEAALKSDAFGATVDALATKVGGFAEKQGKTFEGRMRILAANFDDLQESAGKLIVNVLEPIIPVLTALLTVLVKLGPALVTVGAAFLAYKALTFLPGLLISIGAAMQGFSILTGVGAAVGNFGVALSSLASGPMVLVLAAITSLILILPNLKAAFKDVGDSIGEIVAPEVLPALLDKMGVGKEKVEEFADSAGAVKTWEQDVSEDIHSVSGVFSDLSTKAKLTAEDIIKAFLKQAKAVANYEANMAVLKSRNVPQAILEQLADLGLQGKVIVDTLADANEGDFHRILAAINKTAGGVSGFTQQLNALDGRHVRVFIDTFTGDLPTHAKGFHGVVSGAYPFIAGEAGPERVDITPLNQMKRGMAAPSSGWAAAPTATEVSIYAPVIVNGDVIDTDRWQRKVVDALGSQSWRHAGV